MYPRIVAAKLLIDRCYNEDIDTDDLAKEAYFSKFHFARLFKSAYGCSPHTYLQNVRIHHAKILLSSGKCVEDVCFAVGFNSPTSFAGLFKKITGLSPSAYQYQQKKTNLDISLQPVKYIPGCYLKNIPE